MAESARLALAKAMLANIDFSWDGASPNTIWRQQHPSVRDRWVPTATVLKAAGMKAPS